VFNGIKACKLVWNDMRVSKRSKNLHFGVKYPFIYSMDFIVFWGFV